MQRVSKSPMRFAMLALATLLIATPAAAQKIDTKGEKELTAHGHNVDKASAAADPSRVADHIVDQWRGTQFKFDAASQPRELTAQDVQNLRQQKLGYGEISILLALTAGQPDPTTAKSLNGILGLRQVGAGWGKIARHLGYPSLGAVNKSVKATEAGVEKVSASGKAEKVGQIDKPERAEKVVDRPAITSGRSTR